MPNAMAQEVFDCAMESSPGGQAVDQNIQAHDV